MFEDSETSKGGLMFRSRTAGGRRIGEIDDWHQGAAYQFPREQEAGEQRANQNPLDGPAARAQFTKLLAVYRYELERQADNRQQQSADEDMFDHDQWTAEEINALRERGQTPTVFNLIQTTINWVLGSQRRATMDYKVLPRRKDGAKAAERKSELLRHSRDENDAETQTSLAYADAVKAGIGWLETGEGDPADGPIVFDRHESWRNMLWDSRSRRHDLSDCRYVCRTKWLDIDMATALWPDREGIIRASTEQRIMSSGLQGGATEYGDDAMDYIEDDSNISGEVTTGGAALRQRVRCIEIWFKRPMTIEVMRGGDFDRELFDPWSEGHWAELQTGRATLTKRPREVMHVAIMTETGLLELRRSPYRHNQFPFTPIWGYRRGRDGLPYGMIRGLRDIQRDLNKRASKALHYLNTAQINVEEGSVDDIEELRNEAGRPDGVIVYKVGRQPPKITERTDLADAHVNIMSMDASMIQQVGGVTDENLGRRTNASSGTAITARQDQGALATSMFSDNLRSALHQHGTKKLVNIEQFYTDRQTFRITNSRGNPEYVEINDGAPENAISMFKADYVLAEEDWRATTRQAQAEQLMQLMGQLAATAPMLVVQIIDLVIEATDLPKREEIVKRIRQTTGVADPDEDPNNPSPEMAAAKEAQAKAQQLQERAAQADIAEKEGRAQKATADAVRAQAEADRARGAAARNWLGLRSDNLDQIKRAFETTIAIAGAPGVEAASDALMRAATEEAYRMGMANAEAAARPQPPAPGPGAQAQDGARPPINPDMAPAMPAQDPAQQSDPGMMPDGQLSAPPISIRAPGGGDVARDYLSLPPSH